MDRSILHKITQPYGEMHKGSLDVVVMSGV